jgi:hypothetical protein
MANPVGDPNADASANRHRQMVLVRLNHLRHNSCIANQYRDQKLLVTRYQYLLTRTRYFRRSAELIGRDMQLNRARHGTLQLLRFPPL